MKKNIFSFVLIEMEEYALFLRLKCYRMKKLLQSILLICFTHAISGQSATLSTTKSLRSANNYFIREVIEDEKGGFYSISLPREESYKVKNYVYVDYIDSSMSRASHQILNLREGQKRLKYEYLLKKGGKLWLFCSYLNKKTKKNILYLQEVEKKTFRRKGELKQLTEISLVSAKNTGRFMFTYSAVGNNFLVFSEYPKNTGQGLRGQMLVLSDAMQVVDEQPLHWDIEMGRLRFKNVFYDGENLVFFAHQMVSMEYVFYYRSRRVDKFKRVVVTAKGNSISDVEVFWDKDKIATHGLYKLTKDGPVSGVFSVDFKNGQLENYQQDSFFNEEKKLFSPSIDHDVWSGLTLKKIVNRGKGLLFLVCEQSSDFTVTYQTYNSSPSYGGGYYGGGYYGGYGYGGGYYSAETVSYMSFGHLVLIAVKDGKEIWRKLVPKKQSLEHSIAYYGSVAINSNKKGVFLYFNTSTDPTNSDDGISEFTGNKNYSLTEVFIDDKGGMKHVDVYKSNSLTREIPVISSFYFGQNKTLFLGRKGTQTKLYKLTVKH